MKESKNLIRLIQDEDISSFEELFRFYYPRLKRYAYHFLQDEEQSDDFIQDVFLQLWNKRTELNDEKNAIAFLFVLLKNKCLNALKRKVVEDRFIRKQVSLETEALYHLSISPSVEFESMDVLLSREIELLILEMPEKCGIAFRLKWIEGKKIREIAEIMNISTTMVDKHLARGLEIARGRLNPNLFLLLLLSR